MGWLPTGHSRDFQKRNSTWSGLGAKVGVDRRVGGRGEGGEAIHYSRGATPEASRHRPAD